jgi:3-oxoacyl-[acyl-carrier-protein] synthase II
MTRRVVITGVGAVTPLGIGAQALHDGAVSGATGIQNGQGLCDTFDGAQALGRREKFRMDRFAQLALVAAGEALAQAGWGDTPPVAAHRVPCMIGSAIGGLMTLEEEIEKMRLGGAADVSPLTVPKLMANAAAAHISMRYGLRGETAAVVSACSGGAQAIVAAIRAIRLGEADAAVAGGAEAATTPFTSAIFTTAGALSPSGTSVPFSTDRDGFILGEGAGVMVLEAAEVAEARGATILGEIIGYGVRSDAHHITAPEPTGTCASAAVCAALEDAGLTADDVDYINAHGTGTKLNDATEIVALRRALGAALDTIPLSSSKSYLGHLLGAAGAVEAIATVLALRAKMLPPVHGLTQADPQLGKVNLLSAPQRLNGGKAQHVGVSNSMGFGGHNVTLVLRA